MEAQTTVMNSTQCGLFIGENKKYTLSGVTFSFKSDFLLLNCIMLEERTKRSLCTQDGVYNSNQVNFTFEFLLVREHPLSLAYFKGLKQKQKRFRTCIFAC